jgi:hypothetical protein
VVMFAAPNCTTCATCPAKLLVSKRSSTNSIRIGVGMSAKSSTGSEKARQWRAFFVSAIRVPARRASVLLVAY